ncbi:MAG TPA: hypothetical protein DCX06_11810 [Opitutae bacterium]|nr:hypothetical protein [Opitutae bacterium]
MKQIANELQPKALFSLIFRWLTFRISLEEIKGLNKWHLIAGLIGTWFVGMGRYWDDPGAQLLQHLGLGSVIYIFVLSALLFVFIWGIGAHELSYFRLLTFISLTSFPAILYAIPVERFVDIETATTMNAWFLAIVALWRVSLLILFMRVIGPMSTMTALIAGLLPLMLIIATLTILNLNRVVFNVMAGFQEANAHNGAYEIMLIISFLSFYAALPTLIVYILCAAYRRSQLRTVDNQLSAVYKQYPTGTIHDFETWLAADAARPFMRKQDQLKAFKDQGGKI